MAVGIRGGLAIGCIVRCMAAPALSFGRRNSRLRSDDQRFGNSLAFRKSIAALIRLLGCTVTGNKFAAKVDVVLRRVEAKARSADRVSPICLNRALGQEIRIIPDGVCPRAFLRIRRGWNAPALEFVGDRPRGNGERRRGA
jgi:hypothetical protein